MTTGWIQAKQRKALIGPIRKQIYQAALSQLLLDAELHHLSYPIPRKADSMHGADIIER